MSGNRLALLLLLCSFAWPAAGQSLDSVTALRDSLTAIAAIDDEADRMASLGTLWSDLLEAGDIPFARGTEVLFLHRTSSSAGVSWAGDMSRWQPQAGENLAGTDLWMKAMTFPEDARLDYKVVVGSTWMLDPHNPHQQWSGFGPNSELRMPAWVFPEETLRREGIGRGSLTGTTRIDSEHLGYAVNYTVYTPAGYGGLRDLPVVYVTDGHEYSDQRLGAMVTVLDNLIAEGSIAPVLAVFVDPRKAVGGQNMRMDQYAMNPDFAAFFSNELIPAVDAAYNTRASRYARAIVGTSMGGLNAAYFGSQATEQFYMLGIQSPAFWHSPAIFARFRDAEKLDLRIHMVTGAINDTQDGARTMKAILEGKGYNIRYYEVNQGHSWGNWRGELDDMLIHFFGAASGVFTRPEHPAEAEIRVYPTITSFDLHIHGAQRAEVYDLLGREVLSRTLGRPGVMRVSLASLPRGRYVVRASRGVHTTTTLVTRS